MIYTIKITDQADNDVRNIYEYIAYELQSPENASGQMDRIEKCIMRICQSAIVFMIENRGKVVDFILFR
jgi:plasmid stabilization system protein ParE